MPQEPKKRHSTGRQGKRRASIHLAISYGTHCTNCGSLTVPHAVCKACGYYKGTEVIARKKDNKKTKEST